MRTLCKLLLSALPITVVLFFAWAGVSWTADLPGQWQSLAPSDKNRLEASYVQAGGKFYLAGGTTAQLGLLLQERYDPKTNSWETVEPLPEGLHHVQSVELGGKVYYVGGFGGSSSGPHCEPSDNVYVYDPSNDTFSEETPMPAGRLRAASGIVVHAGKIYVAGGMYDDPDGICDPVAVPWFDVYNPATGTWTQLPDMPRTRNHFHGTVVDGKLYAIGGRQTRFIDTVSQVDVYDLASRTSGSWQTPATALPTSTRSGSAAAVLGKEVVIIGGEGGGIAHEEVEAYDTVNNTWRTLRPMLTPRHGIQAAVCNGGVYVATGGTKQGGSPSTVHEAFFHNGPTTCEPPPGDNAAPVVQKPVHSLPSRKTLGTSTVPVKISWSATDSESGVTRYELQQSVDGGPFTNVTLSSATQTTTTLTLDPGKTYRYQVRAQDGAGHWSGWEQGASFVVDVIQESDSAVEYAGTWSTAVVNSASGGVTKHANATGESADLAFSGASSVAWVAPKGANRGKAEVWVDGSLAKTVDLYSSTTQARRLVFAGKGLDPSVAHAVEVRVLGTKNASSGGTRADVDAFVVLGKVQ